MKHLLKLGYHHWPNTLLHTPSGFLYLFSLKNSGWFLTKTLVAMGWLHSGRHLVTRVCYHLYNQLSCGFYNFLGTKWLFQSGAKSYFKVAQLRQPFVSKWGKRYFKVGQMQLFQIGSVFISKWGNYFKVGQKLFQSGAVISKWGKMLFQSGEVISKRGNYLKWDITLVAFVSTFK